MEEVGASDNATEHKKIKPPVDRWRPVSTEAMSQKCDINEIPNSGRDQLAENSITSNEILVSGGTTNVVIKVSSNAASSSENTLGLQSSPTKVVIEDDMKTSGLKKGPDGSDISEIYTSSIEVGADLMRFVKGKGGSMQKHIEEETGVKIIFPPSRDGNYVALEGKSDESTRKASDMIDNVIKQVVQTRMVDYTHFISLPLAIHPYLVEKLDHFQRSILGASASYRGSDDASLSECSIDKSIFINPRTFHLTLLMLKLWNEDRIAKASNVLQSVSSEVNEALGNRPISIQLKGLTCMKGSPAKARVVYAPVLEVGGEGRLARVCKIIIDAFVESGLVIDRDAKHELKLHATVMNVRHRKSMQWRRGKDSFDARDIFRRYGEEEWGEYPIPEVHLSQRYKFDERGYYHCCSSISLPLEMPME